MTDGVDDQPEKYLMTNPVQDFDEHYSDGATFLYQPLRCSYNTGIGIL